MDAHENVIASAAEEALLGGRVRIRQPARGHYRVNADTVLVAMAAAAPGAARVLELGCGVGAGLLIVAQQNTKAALTGVERDGLYAGFARANAAANGVAMEIIEADVLAAARTLGGFDHIFFNPPYHPLTEGPAPAAARAGARVEEAPVDAWIAAYSNHLVGGGVMTLIHRADKLGEILAGFEGRLGGVCVTPVHPHADAAARRVIVRARKGSRAGLSLRPGLALHDGSGAKHTPQAEALLRGDAAFDWGDR